MLLPWCSGLFSRSYMAHLTFGGCVVPHSVLEGCKTNTFMKKSCFAAEIKLSLFM